MEKLALLGASVARALGNEDSRLSIITSIILAIICFFYIFTLGSFIDANVFVLLNGTTYDTFFHLFLINKSVDHIIIALSAVVWLALSLKQTPRLVIFAIFGTLAAISASDASHNLSTIIVDITAILSIPAIFSVLTYNRFLPVKILIVHSNLSLNYLAIIGIAIGILTIIITSLQLFPVPVSSRIVHDYAFDIYVLFNSASPVIMILLIFCFPVKILAMKLMNRLRVQQEPGSSGFLYADQTLRRKYKFICLLLVMFLSVALAVIPHLPTVNKNNQPVGTDTSYYVDWQNNLTKSKSAQNFAHEIFAKIRGGDRPFSLLLVFAVVKSVPVEPSVVIDNLPLILGPALVLVVYLFTREMISNDRISLLAAFLTAVSFQVLVGIYAGYYANWIALIIGYLAFVFLFRVLKTPTILSFVIYSVLMILLLFSHEYTWTILTIVMAVFLVIMVKLGHYKRRNLIFLLLIILSTVIVDLAKTALIGLSNGFAKDLRVARGHLAGINQFANRWNNLKDTMQGYYAAQFSNFIILILALYWLLRSRLRDVSNILLMVFLSVGIAPLFFGDWVIQSRVFYDIPFQIPAAIGLSYLRMRYNGVLMLLPISLWLIAISFRDVYNFIFPP